MIFKAKNADKFAYKCWNKIEDKVIKVKQKDVQIIWHILKMQVMKRKYHMVMFVVEHVPIILRFQKKPTINNFNALYSAHGHLNVQLNHLKNFHTKKYQEAKSAL